MINISTPELFYTSTMKLAARCVLCGKHPERETLQHRQCEANFCTNCYKHHPHMLRTCAQCGDQIKTLDRVKVI
jgi:hypothetical protein